MKVILLQDVKSLGKRGELVEASDGYARNYLLPRKLAKEANAQAMNEYKNAENSKNYKIATEKAQAEGYKKQLDTLYRSEAVDIAGDVSVIENMMRRDGLTGQDDFRVNTSRRETAASADSGQGASAAAQEGQVLGGH